MKRKSTRRRAVNLIEFLIVWTLVFGVAIGALCWPYTINTWLVYSGKSAAVVWWQGALIGLVPVFGWLSIPAAVATWILMMFLG